MATKYDPGRRRISSAMLARIHDAQAIMGGSVRDFAVYLGISKSSLHHQLRNWRKARGLGGGRKSK